MTLPHGGNIYHYSRKYGIPTSDMLDFSASINPLGPSPKALGAFKRSAGLLDNYPDPDCTRLMTALSAHHGIPPGSILAGNGSTELIYLLPRALRPRAVTVFSPGFSDYERAARLAGCKVRRLRLGSRGGFVPDVEKAAGSLGRSEMLFLCNPNNPTGVLLSRERVLGLARAAARAGAFVVVDEAFIEFSPDASVVRDAPGMRGVAVLRNFTKFFGMPGLRAGYLVGAPGLVEKLRAAQEPWSVNTPAQEAAVASLSDEAYIKKTLRLVNAEREFLYGELSRMDGLRPYPSSANFMLVRLARGPDASRVAEALASKGLLVRDCSNFSGLDGRFIRVAVRTRPENERLIGLLKRAVNFTAK